MTNPSLTSPSLGKRFLRFLEGLRSGLFRTYCLDAKTVPSPTGDRVVADVGSFLPIYERDHVVGPDSAPVTLVEYGDYECAECGRLYRDIAGLLAASGDQIRFVFRQYPFAKLHTHAELAAEAAEAAAAQGKFWEMHEMLFLHQSALREKDLLGYARTLGIDLDRFRCELGNRVHRERVRVDFRSGVSNGVFGTPSIFINGIRHSGAMGRESLRDAICRITCDRIEARIVYSGCC